MALMVGVSGIRGLVGRTLTARLALEFAQAYGTVLGGGRLVLARDTRPSGEMFAAAVAAGLTAAGCRVTDLGVAMTPTVGRTISAGGFAGGMIITASHNPPQWNGLKFLDELGLGPDPQRVRDVAAVRERAAYREISADFAPLERDATAGRRHVEAVLEAGLEDTQPLRGMKVVLDSINGAGCADTPALLAALGCEVVHLNGEPTGEFAHTPEPIEENLGQLCDAVRSERAAVGLAQDPDADRLALVDEQGRFIGEEYTLALATLAMLRRRPGPVVANLSTSRMVDDIAAQHGCRVIRTPVGESHVARAIRASGAVIGGEGNGGVIDPRICLVRDSLSAASLVLQLLAATGRPLSALVSELPRYAMIKQKFECPKERIDAAVAKIAAAFAGERQDRADGVRIDFADAWVHVRPSNTEPIVRLIAEAPTAAAASALLQRVRAAAGM